MTEDHNRLTEIFQLFQNMKQNEPHKLIGLLHVYKSGLRRHILWEEEVIFPFLKSQIEQKNNGATFTDMQTEHHQIEDILGTIHDKIISSDLETDELEKRITEAITSHMIREEEILYGPIDTFLSEKQKMEIYGNMKRVPPEKYKDLCCRNIV